MLVLPKDKRCCPKRQHICKLFLQGLKPEFNCDLSAFRKKKGIASHNDCFHFKKGCYHKKNRLLVKIGVHASAYSSIIIKKQKSDILLNDYNNKIGII